MNARQMQNSLEDRYKFISSILNNMKLSNTEKHERKMKKSGLRKTPKGLGPEDTLVHSRAKEDLQCNCVETVMWRAIGQWRICPSNEGHRQLGMFKESCIHGIREDLEHRQFRETLLQTRKIDIYRKNVTKTWKAIRGFWDGSFKDDGKSG